MQVRQSFYRSIMYICIDISAKKLLSNIAWLMHKNYETLVLHAQQTVIPYRYLYHQVWCYQCPVQVPDTPTYFRSKHQFLIVHTMFNHIKARLGHPRWCHWCDEACLVQKLGSSALRCTNDVTNTLLISGIIMEHEVTI